MRDDANAPPAASAAPNAQASCELPSMAELFGEEEQGLVAAPVPVQPPAAPVMPPSGMLRDFATFERDSDCARNRFPASEVVASSSVSNPVPVPPPSQLQVCPSSCASKSCGATSKRA